MFLVQVLSNIGLSTSWSGLGDKKMHPLLTIGVIGSGGSDHQRAAGGSVGVENLENDENKRENGENKHMKIVKNPAKIFEVSPEPA